MKMRLKPETIIVPVVLIFCVTASMAHAELVALWEFDYGTGHDSCGCNHGTVYSEPNWVDGRIGGALQFDGIDDYIDCGNNARLDITDKITIAAWVKLTNAGNGQDFPFVVKGDHSYAIKHHRENNIEFFIYDGYWHSALSRIDSTFNDKWHHLTGTYDGIELKLYIDGRLKTTTPHLGMIESRENNLNIGRNPERNRFFKGIIDDVCIFNHALTEDEIEQLYNHSGIFFLPKSHVEKLVEQAQTTIEKLKPQEAISFLENQISEYEKWRVVNLDSFRSQDTQMSSDMYFLLAKAKEAAGAPTQEVIAAYKKSVSQPQRPYNYIPAALVWLSDKIPTDEYNAVIKECVKNCEEPSRLISHIAGYFESQDYWDRFEFILDAVFSETNDPVLYGITITKGIEKNREWTDKFTEYCRSKPECTGFIFHKQEKDAERHIAQKDFKKAAEVYQNIIKQCTANQRKNIYELKLYECLFNDGQYNEVIETIDSFIKNNKATERALTIRATLLKGQVYVYMGNPNAAIDTFLKLIIEYPQSEQAPEANFITGYCLMLQGNYPQATEAFNLLIRDYPESSYKAQAESYLVRIKNMTE